VYKILKEILFEEGRIKSVISTELESEGKFMVVAHYYAAGDAI
jgi:superfamily II RNA helicase